MSKILAVWPAFYVPGAKYQPLMFVGQEVGGKELVTVSRIDVSSYGVEADSYSARVHGRASAVNEVHVYVRGPADETDRLWFSYPIAAVSLEYEIFSDLAREKIQ